MSQTEAQHINYSGSSDVLNSNEMGQLDEFFGASVHEIEERMAAIAVGDSNDADNDYDILSFGQDKDDSDSISFVRFLFIVFYLIL